MKQLPSTEFVTLSEALNWIAFGDSSDTYTRWDEYAHAKLQLEEALEKFLDKAAGGIILVRGKLVKDPDAHPVALDTDDIPAARFHDFGQFDQTCCGLRSGKGLFGFAEEVENSFEYAYRPFGKKEFYSCVKVRREDLDRVFPSSAVGPKVTLQQVVRWCRDWIANGGGNDMNTAWQAFSADHRFKGCSRDDWLRPAWREAKIKYKQ